MTIRIAMWSGPRNISTAMMRAWENRPDAAVVDEPLYAAYLATTGIAHPMQGEVIASLPTTYPEAIAAITTTSCSAAVQYQKHMTHHVLAETDLGWLGGLRNAFLIRDPRRVVASYARKRGQPTLEDLGFPQQLRLYEHLLATGVQPPVVLAEDVLRHPEATLRKLCEALDVPFYTEMLRWPPGRRESDGVWAPHWYESVWNSTAFAPPRDATPELTAELAELADRAHPIFERLYADRLRT